ncbi:MULTISPECIES: hypothetical protein [unclassified Streptomyces]|uniref:hypothetical protein n=1 Tax=unclassified Streptomyces TaxID=2593676 RepID=UPI0033DA8484
MIEIIAGALTLPTTADSHTSARPALVVDHLDAGSDDSVALFTFCTLMPGTSTVNELSHA